MSGRARWHSSAFFLRIQPNHQIFPVTSVICASWLIEISGSRVSWEKYTQVPDGTGWYRTVPPKVAGRAKGRLRG